MTTSTSLCPTGWRLPSGGAAYASDSTTGVNVTGDTSTYRDFYNLGYKIMDEVKTAYEDTAGSDGAYYSDNTTNLVGDTATKAFRKYPNNFVLSGYVYNGSISNRNSYGLYWSSTARNTDYAYRLYMNNSVVYPSTAGGNKFYGRSVRCVTNPTQRHEVTVNFDSGVESVTLRSAEFGTKTVTTSGTVVSLVKDTEYTISGTYATDYGFKSWTTTSNGTLGATDNAETTYTVSGTATLTLNSKRICSQGYICYDKNNRDANAPGGDMGDQTVSSASATLWAPNFKSDDYGFAGWNTKADGTGTSYGPNETIEFDTTDEDGLLLYAMWTESEGDLQDWSCPNNTIMPIGTVIGLTDARDNQTYAVAKLADGNCWMVENLRLADKDSGGNDIDLDSSYTNNPSLPLTNVYDLNTTSDHLSPTTSVNYNPSTAPEGWCGYNNAACLDQSRLRTDNTVLFTNNTSSNYNTSNNVYSYGNYYNWYSATAGHGTYATSSGDTAGDICPAGWHLPTGGNANSEFVTLDIKLGGTGDFQTGDAGSIQSNKWRSYPNNFIYNGYVAGSSINYRGLTGNYWSSSAADNTRAHSVSFGGGGIDPSMDLYAKNSGRAARCIIHKTTIIDDLEYMQDFAKLTADEKTEVLDSMVQDEQYQLTDNRDNKVYYITKLGDGHVWMTQNLDFDIVNGGADIKSTNTDVPSDWADAGKLRNTYQTNNNTWDYYVEEPESYDPGDWCWNGTIRNDWEGTISNSTVFCSQEGEHFHLGNYYNWTAAVASSDTDYESEENFDKNQSICPAGWTLPKDTETNHSPGTFSYLIDELGLAEGRSGNLHQYPYYYAYGGDWEGRSSGVGSYGYYNTSIIFSYSEVYSFSFSRLDGMDTEIHTTGRGAGYSLRCVAR